jgi:hypothetical protein
LKDRIKEALHNDGQFVQLRDNLLHQPLDQKGEGYQLTEEGLLIYKGRLYIPNSIELKKLILDELHKKPYSGHPGYQKMITAVKK